MKILICGDKQTGKDYLFNHLKQQSTAINGQFFSVATVKWQNEVDDLVKLELWNVHGQTDLSVIDVYSRTNGVIFLYDSAQESTFQFAVNEMQLIPLTVPVLILSEKSSSKHKDAFETIANRRTASTFIENSVSAVHSFVEFCFLQLQRDYLLNQLLMNSKKSLQIRKKCNLKRMETVLDLRVEDILCQSRQALAHEEANSTEG